MVNGQRAGSSQVLSADDAMSETGSLYRRDRRTMIVLVMLGVAAVKQCAIVLLYPPFQGHDEVAHLGNIRVIDRLGRLPTLGDDLPLSWVEFSRFTLDWPALYTANHPPLYYLLAWPFFRLAGDDPLAQLYAVRFFAVPWFLATIWLSYLLARLLSPDGDFLPLTVPAMIAFQPQLAFEGAIVNNDILAIAIGAALLYVTSLALRDGLPSTRALLLGVLLGLGLLTKATLTVFVPVVVGVAIWLVRPRAKRDIRSGIWWRDAGWRVTPLVLPAILIPLPWYVFLWHTYGDITAFRALDDLQATWGPPAGSLSEQLASWSFHRERLHEMWGYFGWKLLPLSRVELWTVEIATGISLAGVLVGLVRVLVASRASNWSPSEPWRISIVAMLGGTTVLMYAAMLYAGTQIFITQVRYAFPIMPALAILAMLGIRSLIPARAQRVGAAVLVVGVMGFQAVVLSRLVLPYVLSGS